MIYLLAKYTLLFVLTALLGFVLGYWFSRRNIEDVTESFEYLRKANDRSDATQWERLWMHLHATPTPKETDLSSVYERIDNVSSAIADLPKPLPVNLETVEKRLDSLGAMVHGIPVPLTPAPVDLGPINHRLSAIEAGLAGLGKRLAERRPVESVLRNESSNETRNQPRILKAALYGTKDNLQSISGIGPKLEGLLNQNGVFYFWQVAEWTKQDIDIIDERLDVFQGRIERDSWVSQAEQLKNQPGAARVPAE